jgi:hypothetical protein
VIEESQEKEPEKIIDQPPSKEAKKEKEVEEEHISLDSDLGGLEDRGTESSSSQATPIKPTRGWKSKKKEREEKTYRDVLQGSQQTLKGMINTRSTKKKGSTPKGATPPPR